MTKNCILLVRETTIKPLNLKCFFFEDDDEMKRDLCGE